jgi:hypothetical protein
MTMSENNESKKQFPDTGKIVIYHADCMDGLAAAWAIRKNIGCDHQFIAARHGDTPPDVTGKDVIIVDFSYRRKVLEDMASKAARLRLIDHHKSARQELGDLHYCSFDMNRSGAGMAWDTYHSSVRPWFISYIEDRDLWRFILPHSKEVNAYIGTLPHNWDALNTLDCMDLENVWKLGSGVLAGIDAYVMKMMKHAYTIPTNAGDKVPIVNCPPPHVSEVVGALASESPTGWAIGWFLGSNGRYYYSLRARHGGADVSAIAREYGGGGHAAAAGFESSCLITCVVAVI